MALILIFPILVFVFVSMFNSMGLNSGAAAAAPHCYEIHIRFYCVCNFALYATKNTIGSIDLLHIKSHVCQSTIFRLHFPLYNSSIYTILIVFKFKQKNDKMQ